MGVGPVGPVPSPQPWQKQKPYPQPCPPQPYPPQPGGGVPDGGQPVGVDVASGWRGDVSPGGGMPMPAQMPPQSSYAMPQGPHIMPGGERMGGGQLPPGLQGLSMAEVSKDGMASPYGGGLGAMPEGLQKIAALRQLQQLGGPRRLPPVWGQRKF